MGRKAVKKTIPRPTVPAVTVTPSQVEDDEGNIGVCASVHICKKVTLVQSYVMICTFHLLIYVRYTERGCNVRVDYICGL